MLSKLDAKLGIVFGFQKGVAKFSVAVRRNPLISRLQ